MKQCPHCGASMPDGVALCPACGEQLHGETGSPAEEASADDLFAEASRQESERRAAYRAKKRRAAHKAGEGAPAEEAPPEKSAAADPFAAASREETERRHATKEDGETPEDGEFTVEEPDGAAKKQLKPIKKTVLRIAAIAAVGGLLIWLAQGFGKKLNPEPESSLPQSFPSGLVDANDVIENAQPICYFRGNQPYYSPDGYTEYELGELLAYSWDDTSMPVDTARKYALSDLRSSFAAHTRMSADGSRIFFPSFYRTDAGSLEENGYLLNYIDLTHNGNLFENITDGNLIFGDYWLADASGSAVAFQSRSYLGTKSLSIRYLQGDMIEFSQDVREVWTPKIPNGTVYCWTGEQSEEGGGAMNNTLYSISTGSGYNLVSALQSDVMQLKRPEENPDLIFFVTDKPEGSAEDGWLPSFNAVRLQKDVTSYSVLIAWEEGMPWDFDFMVYPDGSCYYTSHQSGKEEWALFDADTMESSQLAFDTDDWYLDFAVDYPMILLSRKGDAPAGEPEYMLVNRGRLCNITWDEVGSGILGDAEIADIRITEGEPGLAAELSGGEDIISFIVQGNVSAATQVGQDNQLGQDVQLTVQTNTQNISDGIISTRNAPATLIAETGSPGLVSISVLGNRIARNVQLASIRYDRVHNVLICISDYADDTSLGTLTLIFFSDLGGTRFDVRQRVSQLTVPQRDNVNTFPQYIYYVSEADDGSSVWSFNLDALSEQFLVSGPDYFILSKPEMLDFAGALYTRAAFAMQP